MKTLSSSGLLRALAIVSLISVTTLPVSADEYVFQNELNKKCLTTKKNGVVFAGDCDFVVPQTWEPLTNFRIQSSKTSQCLAMVSNGKVLTKPCIPTFSTVKWEIKDGKLKHIASNLCLNEDGVGVSCNTNGLRLTWNPLNPIQK